MAHKITITLESESDVSLLAALVSDDARRLHRENYNLLSAHRHRLASQLWSMMTTRDSYNRVGHHAQRAIEMAALPNHPAY